MKQRNLAWSTAAAALGVVLAGGSARADDEEPASSNDQTETDRHVAETKVYFEFDSSELGADARGALDQAATWIKDSETGLILIEGHADKVGTEPYNKHLASRRAEAAKRYLLSLGVTAEKIRILSYGEGLPNVETEEPSRANRRIVLMAVQKEPIVETETRTKTDVVEKPVYVDRLVPTPVETTVYVNEPFRPIGLDVLAGGGVTGFLDDHTNDVTDVGGTWTARVVARNRSFVGFEVAYVGSAQDIDAIGVDDNAVVLGNGLEGNVRLNISPRTLFQPYLFAGLGWTHYQVENTDVNTSSIEGDDDVLHIPAGVGLGFRITPRVMLDLRATLRGAADDGMFDGGTEEDDGMESLSSSAQLGFAF